MITRKKLPRYVNSIQCPVDLDSLVMSSECTPKFIEENLNVGDDIFWDAVGNSTLSYWLLKLDVMEQFSREMRRRIFWALPNFSRMNRVYFYIQLMNTRCHANITDELHLWESENPSGTQHDFSIGMINPMNMLSNNMKEWDRKILDGELELRRFLLDRIRGFLSSGNRDEVDFSHSLFLPELLSPKFFRELSEAEHIVILGNMDKYFRYVEKFNKAGFARGNHSRGELNHPQNLIKHILSGETEYTRRVKMIAWKQLYKEIDHLMGNKNPCRVSSLKVFDDKAVEDNCVFAMNRLNEKGYGQKEISEWLNNAEGVFESFELDCTLHNLYAIDFLPVIIVEKQFYRMSDGLIEFQDDTTRDKLFRQLSSMMVSYR